MEGAKKEGTKGFFKGVGQGTMGIVAKPGSGTYEQEALEKRDADRFAAMFGLFAYPAQGVYKSIKGAQKSHGVKAAETGRTQMMAEREQPMAFQQTVVDGFQEMSGN